MSQVEERNRPEADSILDDEDDDLMDITEWTMS